nr:TIP41-like protein [Procambarus clarkii]XP_045599078.1 TIP41-like protein [Procambarus clarkii]XP_045599079.1 TIP41-like protein [Procambarus clarkii]XP_045599080.1 TIP41-like protein [Procambarus clarkii]XP_045599081.1 TIP41-like protein [Procambarus clarkii]XP_045599082.1 TIP41-like protein [Procambarus clarkii]XP_045599083.1 TIP41-like protein [Procambarus clarkii]
MSNPVEPRLPPPVCEEFVFGEWTLRVTKSHIMGSQCESPTQCEENTGVNKLCNWCRYEKLLTLPSLPDMVFANNCLQIEHKDGGSISFNAFDALECVNDREDTLQVAHAEVWKEARADCEFVKKVVKPYDWTYTTNFRGTLSGGLKAETSTERIDLDKLRVREEIKFYEEIFLYEDELDDNGSTRCVVKVRVMPSGFFVVFRHYLRVDQVIVRVNDTRLYSPVGASYIQRETSSREAPISKLHVDSSVYNNPDLVWQHLPLVNEKIDKLVLES